MRRAAVMLAGALLAGCAATGNVTENQAGGTGASTGVIRLEMAVLSKQPKETLLQIFQGVSD